MKKFIAVACLAVIGAFAVAACSQKAEDAQENAPLADGSAIPDTTTPASPTPSDTVMPTGPSTPTPPPPGEPIPTTPSTDTPAPDTMGKPPTTPPQ